MRTLAPALLIAALPAPVLALDLDCAVARICAGPADALACMDLDTAPTVRLHLPDEGDGEIAAGDVTMPLSVDRRFGPALDLSWLNDADSYRVVAHLDLDSGRMETARITGTDYELAMLACTEAA